jgi:hypothetical protein
MSTREKIMVVLSGAMLISSITSCRKSPATVLPTNTPVALALTVSANTSTAVPATKTPTSTPIDLSGFVTGTPASEWNDIPVMPGAIAGSETSSGYLYTTTAAPSEVASFYTRELPKLGWNPQPGNGTPEPSGVLTLVFFKGQEVCLVGIIQQKDGALVMLGRQAK